MLEQFALPGVVLLKIVFQAEQAQPGNEFGGGGFLAHGFVAGVEEKPDQLAVGVFGGRGDDTESFLHDFAQIVGIREFDVEKCAAAQKWLRQVFFGIGGQDNEDFRSSGFFECVVLRQFADAKAVFFDLVEDVVGEIARSLVHLVYQHHRLPGRFGQFGQKRRRRLRTALAHGDGQTERLQRNVVGGVCRAAVSQVGGLKVRQGIVGVKQVAGPRGGFGVKQQGQRVKVGFPGAEVPGRPVGQRGFAGAGFAGEQQGLFEVVCPLDGVLQAGRHDVPFGDFA